MIAADIGLIKQLPERFNHDPTLRNEDCDTVAFIAANNCYIEDLPV